MRVRRRAWLLESLESRCTPATLPAGFIEEVMASGLQDATAMQFAPDGKLFALEQAGTLEVWDNGVRVQADFFADTPLATNTISERGLLGIAFDPDYATNRHVYVYYTSPDGDFHNQVSRFTANAAGDRALPASEVVLWTGDPHSAGNHNGGAIHFGPDGKLYIATGDNATGTTAQSLTSLHGKMLRLNPDGSIPEDNPFFAQTTGRFRAIWALGLRNPFTFAFQPGTSRLFINDVGQNTWEEINVGVAGANYGWPGVEGPAGTPPTSPGTYRAPLYTYDHGGAAPNGAAITGGAFYNPAVNTFGAAFQGDYFFTDVGAGWIYRLDFNPGSNSFAAAPVPFASNLTAPVDLKADSAGNLYYLSRGEGRVYRITPSPRPIINTSPASQTITVGRPVSFTVAASGDNLRYQWQRADAATPTRWAPISGATAATFSLPRTALTDNGDRFRVIVGNRGGSVASAVATLTVTPDRAPSAEINIVSGLRDGKFDAGTEIAFSGTAADPEDGPLGAASLRWRVDYLTSIRAGDLDRDGLPGLTRPFVQPFSGADAGTFTPATTGPYTLTDVAYVIRLTVTDSAGLRSSRALVIQPNTIRLTLAANVPGLTLTRDGQPVVAPVTFSSVVGFERPLGAAATQSLGPVSYEFLNWSDGGGPSHVVATPATDTTYTAAYRAVSTSGTIRVEAESFTLTGYQRVSAPFAYGGRFIQATADTASARGTFYGPDGRYRIYAVVFDETDGESQMEMRLGGSSIATWTLDENRGSHLANAQTRVMRNLGLHDITQGTTIELLGQRDGNELARFDALLFVPVAGDLVRAINAGGGNAGRFESDTSFDGGVTPSNPTPVNAAAVSQPAPTAAYATWRAADLFRYTLDGLSVGATYLVRLHFVEHVATAAGQRVFSVEANGTTVISDLDVFQQAGGRHRAIAREFTATADASGNLVLDFRASAGRAMLSAIEVFSV
ncbi:MAG: PQQ-dependent sugar dehydrogenase [Gemmataceae bacterium]